MDFSELASRVEACRGDVYLNPRTNTVFDLDKYNVDMVDIASSFEQIVLDQKDAHDQIVDLFEDWSFMLIDSDIYVHVYNDGTIADIGLSEADTQVELEASFELFVKDDSSSVNVVTDYDDVDMSLLFPFDNEISKNLSNKSDYTFE